MPLIAGVVARETTTSHDYLTSVPARLWPLADLWNVCFLAVGSEWLVGRSSRRRRPSRL